MPACLVVLAPREFHDREYLDTVDALAAGGVRVETASLHAGPAFGACGLVVRPDRRLDDCRAEAFDAVALIGGIGVRAYLDHAPLARLLRAAIGRGATVGAICYAPMVLLRAGLAEGRRVAIHPPDRGRLPLFGALPAAGPVCEDGPLVTAEGPRAAAAFGAAIARRLLTP